MSFRVGDRIRLILAGFFVVIGLALLGVVLSQIVPKGPPALLGLGIAVCFLLLCLIALVLFNRPLEYSPALAPGKLAEDLENKKLLSSEDFKAIRAFQVEEVEDEGSTYYIELEDHSVLYLNGQYLYDYEEPRQFPCTDFTIRRHRDEGFVVDILCRGRVLEPEVVVPPFDESEFPGGAVPEDGQVIRDRNYDQIKEERLNRRWGA